MVPVISMGVYATGANSQAYLERDDTEISHTFPSFHNKLIFPGSERTKIQGGRNRELGTDGENVDTCGRLRICERKYRVYV